MNFLGSPFVRRGIVPGLTVFAGTVWLVPFVPSFLAASGLEISSNVVIMGMILSTVLATLGHALLTNRPEVLAPGVVPLFYMVSLHTRGVDPVPWDQIFTLAFYTGLAFFVLAVSGLLKRAVRLVPESIKQAMFVAIGLYLIVQGLKAGEVIAPGPQGHLFGVVTFGHKGLCFVAGVLTALVLHQFSGTKNWAILAGVLLATLVAFFGGMVAVPETSVMIPRFSKLLDLPQPSFYLPLSLLDELAVFLVLLVVDVVSTYIVVSKADRSLMDQSEMEPRDEVKATSALGGAMTVTPLGCGVPVITTFESLAGVLAGGRDRRCAIVAALLFALLLFFMPLAGIFPIFACAVAPTYVGYEINKTAWRFLTHNREARYLMLAALIGCLVLGSISMAVLGILAVYPFVLWKTQHERDRPTLSPSRTAVVCLVSVMSLVLLFLVGRQ